jgi:roadblock/LC7 domain-containing protein
MIANKDFFFSLRLDQEGSVITGTMTRTNGNEPADAVQGRAYPGGAIEFRRSRVDQLYQGNANDYSMSGKFQGQFPWSAKRPASEPGRLPEIKSAVNFTMPRREVGQGTNPEVSFEKNPLPPIASRDFDELPWSSVQFSPDGRGVSYAARKGRKWVAVTGNQKSDEFDELKNPVLSADGTAVAYAARSGQKWSIVIGNSKGADFDEVGIPAFSPDGKSVAYAARKGQKRLMIAEDKESAEFDEISLPGLRPAYTADGKGPVYAARNGQKWFTVIADKKSGEFDEVKHLTFSADRKAVAFAARKGQGWHVVTADKEGEEFDEVGPPVWSSDGKGLDYSDRKGAKWLTAVEHTKGQEFDLVTTPSFSPDGEVVAYAVRKGHKMAMVAGGETGEEFDGISGWYPANIQDSRQPVVHLARKDQKLLNRVAYMAMKGRKFVMVVAGKSGEEFDKMGFTILRPDRKDIAYHAKKRKKR